MPVKYYADDCRDKKIRMKFYADCRREKIISERNHSYSRPQNFVFSELGFLG